MNCGFCASVLSAAAQPGMRCPCTYLTIHKGRVWCVILVPPTPAPKPLTFTSCPDNYRFSSTPDRGHDPRQNPKLVCVQQVHSRWICTDRLLHREPHLYRRLVPVNVVRAQTWLVQQRRENSEFDSKCENDYCVYEGDYS